MIANTAYLIATGALIWGIGSAMMNGVHYSSLGPCLLVFAVFEAIAWVSS